MWCTDGTQMLSSGNASRIALNDTRECFSGAGGAQVVPGIPSGCQHRYKSPATDHYRDDERRELVYMQN